jgi:hypothetical protein
MEDRWSFVFPDLCEERTDLLVPGSHVRQKEAIGWQAFATDFHLDLQSSS